MQNYQSDVMRTDRIGSEHISHVFDMNNGYGAGYFFGDMMQATDTTVSYALLKLEVVCSLRTCLQSTIHLIFTISVQHQFEFRLQLKIWGWWIQINVIY